MALLATYECELNYKPMKIECRYPSYSFILCFCCWIILCSYFLFILFVFCWNCFFFFHLRLNTFSSNFQAIRRTWIVIDHPICAWHFTVLLMNWHICCCIWYVQQIFKQYKWWNAHVWDNFKRLFLFWLIHQNKKDEKIEFV